MFNRRIPNDSTSIEQLALSLATEDDLLDLGDADTVQLEARVHELFQESLEQQPDQPLSRRPLQVQPAAAERSNTISLLRSQSLKQLAPPKQAPVENDPLSDELRMQSQIEEAELRLTEPLRQLLTGLVEQGVLESADTVQILEHRTHHKVTTYELLVDGRALQFIDATDPKAYNMMAVHRFVEGLKSKRDCIRDLVRDRARAPQQEELEVLYARAVEQLTQISLSLHNVGSKKWSSSVEEACEAASSVTAHYIVSVCQAMRRISGLSDFQPNLLQACENQRNGRRMRSIVTIYRPTNDFEGKDHYLVEAAVPLSDKQNVSGWRMEGTLCNAFERSAFLQTRDGLKALARLSTHSSLAPIGVGKVLMRDGRPEVTGTKQRLARGLSAFRDVLKAAVRERMDVTKLEDLARVDVALSWTTLFTPIREALDLRFRGMEAESLMLQESSFIYQLCQGQEIPIEVDGKRLIAIPDTQMINLGCNFHATSSSKLAFSLRNAELEDPINRLGLEQLLEACEGAIDVSDSSVVQGLIEARGHVRERMSSMESRLDKERKALLDLLLGGSSGLDATDQFEDLCASFRAAVQERDNEVAIAHSYTKQIYRDSLQERLVELGKRRQEIERLKVAGPPTGMGSARGRVNWQKKLQRLELEADILQLYLEIQELMIGADDKGGLAGRDKDHVYHVQFCAVRLAALLKRLAGLNCKSAEDRTGAFWCALVIFTLVRELTGVYPPLSKLFAKSKQHKAAAAMMAEKGLHQASFEFGVSSAINCLNNPGTPGMQVGKKVNPMQERRAKVGKLGGEFAKAPYKAARELWKQL